MISSIQSSIKNFIHSLVPQEGQSIPDRTHAAAAAVLAATAYFDPLLTCALGATYVLGATMWNRAAADYEPVFFGDIATHQPEARQPAVPAPQIVEEEDEKYPIEEDEKELFAHEDPNTRQALIASLLETQPELAPYAADITPILMSDLPPEERRELINAVVRARG